MQSLLKLARGVVAVALITAVAGVIPLGCNTTEGVGKDVESGGRALKNAAKDAKD